MANWEDIAFSPGQTDYIGRMNALLDRAENIATEVEDGRGGQASLAAIIALLVRSTGLTANLNFAGFRGVGAADPVNPQDLATRAFVNAVVAGGGSPGSIPVTSLNFGTMSDGHILRRLGAALVSVSISDLLANNPVARIIATRDVPAISANLYQDGPLEIQAFAGDPAVLGFHRVGFNAIALYYNGNDAFGPILSLRDNNNGDFRLFHRGFSVRVLPGVSTGRAMCWNNASGEVESLDDVLDSRGNLRDIPVIEISANTTVSATNHRGVMLRKSGATALNMQIDPGLPVGFSWEARNANAAGNINVVRGSGVELRIAGLPTNANAAISPWGAVLFTVEANNVVLARGEGIA